MEFPEDVVQIIRDFARPLWTRPDWKWCKWEESICIKQKNRDSLLLCSYLFRNVAGLCDEHVAWSLYGRMRLVKIFYDLKNDIDEDWYETQFDLYWP